MKKKKEKKDKKIKKNDICESNQRVKMKNVLLLTETLFES